MKNSKLVEEINQHLVEQARENIGNAPLSRVMREINQIFASRNIPYEIIGGYAVQHYGYVRTTQDVDLIVRELDFARRTLLSTDKFKAVQGNEKQLIHRETGVEVDLLVAGSRGSQGSLPYPEPSNTPTSTDLSFISLPGLVALKLSSGRIKDEADVAELIKKNKLPNEFKEELPDDLQAEFERIWGRARKEQLPPAT
jgi:hypothetical protein